MKAWLHLLNELETPFCRLWSHRSSQRRYLSRSFAVISRLGDGVFWYMLMAAMVVFDGLDGMLATAHMVITGGLSFGFYKALKGTTRRERPCNYALDINAIVAPLDRYSFPSGHTLHAVAFTYIALHYYPQLAWLLIPLTLLIALSRVILGLHYPSDVIVATIIGFVLGYSSILILG